MRIFHVRGSGNFPLSLLAIDECFPASLVEAEKMSYAMPTQAKEQTIELRTRMATISHQKWKEAKWPVVHVE